MHTPSKPAATLLLGLALALLPAPLAQAQEAREVQSDESRDPAAARVGEPVPPFAVEALETGEIYSDERLAGQTYLLDFWAVWCGPCVEELPALHDAYEMYADQGFTILSLSFDDAPGDVRAFREAKQPMPWKHAFVEGGFESEIADTFEVVGLPRPILVGPDGIVLAMGQDLRSQRILAEGLLMKTLAEVFETNDTPDRP